MVSQEPVMYRPISITGSLSKDLNLTYKKTILTVIQKDEQTPINRNFKTSRQNITLSKKAKFMGSGPQKKNGHKSSVTKGALKWLSVLPLKIQFFSQQIRV